jgi:hypothetical protein
MRAILLLLAVGCAHPVRAGLSVPESATLVSRERPARLGIEGKTTQWLGVFASVRLTAGEGESGTLELAGGAAPVDPIALMKAARRQTIVVMQHDSEGEIIAHYRCSRAMPVAFTAAEGAVSSIRFKCRQAFAAG